MRQLHVVALSDDGSHLLLGASRDAAKPTHRIAVDDRLRAALRGELAPPGSARVESALTPKEVQARLRGGETPEEVARAAGVPTAWVLRYAGPVLSERERIVDQARNAVVLRPRREPSVLPLGAAVERQLAGVSGLRHETVEWSARRRDDGAWVVSLSYAARGRTRTASWVLDNAHRTAAPIDTFSAKLGHADDDSPLVASEPAPRRTTKRAAPARKAAPAKQAAPAKNAAPARKAAPAKKAVAKKAASTPARKATTTQSAAKRAAAATRKAGATRKAAAPKKAAAARKPVTRRPRIPSPKPPPPPPVREASPYEDAARQLSNSRASGGRPSVPSWSDVLLGVASAADRDDAKPDDGPAR